MDDKLIFIHLCGTNWDSETTTYQLLFANDDDIEDFNDDTWGIFPSSGRPITPPKEIVSISLTIDTNLTLILAQNSTMTSMFDAVDKIIPLGYEDINGYDIYPDYRLVLHYGLTVDEVEKMLSMVDITTKKTHYRNE